MSQLVSDLIDFTRTRLGDGLPLVRRPMDLGAAAQEARSGDLRGTWDEGRMKQALTNLIENAAQHATPETPITVSVSGAGDHVVLIVHNHEISGKDFRHELATSLRRPSVLSLSNLQKEFGLSWTGQQPPPPT